MAAASRPRQDDRGVPSDPARRSAPAARAPESRTTVTDTPDLRRPRAAARRAVAHRRPARRHGVHVAVQPRVRAPAGRPASSCASRTPTARASARTASSRSSTPCTGSGCTWDEGPDVGGPYAPYRQSERLDTYRPYVERLLAEGHAYHCWCSTERLAQMREAAAEAEAAHRATTASASARPRGARRAARLHRDAGRAHAHPRRRAARLRRPHPRPGLGAAPGRPGDPQGRRLPDLPPRRRRRRPRDGHHPRRARRGVDQLAPPSTSCSTAGSGLEPPAFAHMPLLRNTDKSKISKRKNPAARLTWFQEQGYLPEALVNFLALLAYPPQQDAEGDDVEVFTFEEFSAATSTGPRSTRSARSSTSRSSTGSTASTSATLEVGELATPAAALPPAPTACLGDNPVARRAGPARGGHRADPDADGAC